jgi:hypothetical protein
VSVYREPQVPLQFSMDAPSIIGDDAPSFEIRNNSTQAVCTWIPGYDRGGTEENPRYYWIGFNITDGAGFSSTQKICIAVKDSEQPSFSINATAGVGGQISPAGSISVPCGDDQIFNITADANYEIEDSLVDGVSIGPVNTYTFHNVLEDHAIQVQFRSVDNGSSSSEGFPDYFGLECINNRILVSQKGRAIIDVYIKEKTMVNVKIYNNSGYEILTICQEEKDQGIYRYFWDGKDTTGKYVGSGIYFVYMKADSYKATKKIAVVK